MIDHFREGPYRDFAQEHRSGGTFGAAIIDVHQEPGEFADPATGEFLFVANLNAPDRAWQFNGGSGWTRHAPQPGLVHVHFPDADTEFATPFLHLRCAVLDAARIHDVFGSVGLPRSALDAAFGRFDPLPRAVQALNTVWNAAHRDDPAAALDLDGAFLTMLGEVIAACGHGLPPAPALQDTRLARAVDYAETHIAAPLTVGELAGAAAMSPSAFSRAFLAATGETPWAYVRRRRLERAGERLARTDDTLADIAHDCGFADASHLARCWKAAHGRTPREDRG